MNIKSGDYSFDLSPLERNVFNTILKSKYFLTYKNILELITENKWNNRSIYTALNNLKKKGLIEEAGKIKVARTRAILYKATLSEAEYYDACHRAHFEKINDSSVDFVLSALTGHSKNSHRTEEVINEIENWIALKQQELEKDQT